jgi:ectoine hydroxylase-related dioxygenase (phytanoyl-CoA dioxygenase family)
MSAAALHVERLARDGYAVVRGVFSADEVARMAASFDALYAQGVARGASWRHQNVHVRVARDAALGPVVRLVQWPSYVDPVLDAVRRDPRMFAIVRPLLGDDIKQIINQLHWKPPGAATSEFGYHQDIRFRRPREAYRNPARSFVQTGIAVDPHGRANGGMTFLPGSHRAGELGIGPAGRVMDASLSGDDLAAVGLDPAAAVDLDLAPGDVALWTLFAVHGSHPNRAAIDRRLYINGYVAAADCDRGAWTWRAGAPCELGPPVLIHYDDVFTRPEPHFVEGG